MFELENVEKHAVEMAIRAILQELNKELEVAEKQFKEAHGLFIDAFALKISYITAYRNAVLNELEELTTNE